MTKRDSREKKGKKTENKKWKAFQSEEEEPFNTIEVDGVKYDLYEVDMRQKLLDCLDTIKEYIEVTMI